MSLFLSWLAVKKWWSPSGAGDTEATDMCQIQLEGVGDGDPLDISTITHVGPAAPQVCTSQHPQTHTHINTHMWRFRQHYFEHRKWQEQPSYPLPGISFISKWWLIYPASCHVINTFLWWKTDTLCSHRLSLWPCVSGYEKQHSHGGSLSLTDTPIFHMTLGEVKRWGEALVSLLPGSAHCATNTIIGCHRHTPGHSWEPRWSWMTNLSCQHVLGWTVDWVGVTHNFFLTSISISILILCFNNKHVLHLFVYMYVCIIYVFLRQDLIVAQAGLELASQSRIITNFWLSSLYLLSDGIGDWTQNHVHATQACYHLSHNSVPCGTITF